MTSPIALCSIVPVLLLSGCMNGPREPQDYSPGYSYVSTDTGGSEKGVGGSVLAPDACLAEPADDDGTPAATRLTIVSGVGSQLPAGCANAYNLQRMAESQRDLVEGRQLGKAAAAPSARAARRYLDGEEAPTGGANSAPPTTPQTTLPVE
ncbi:MULTISPECIES: hypothetical protein [unclassified Mesorhizobium]|uniref:hypothetical protein n=1 Tax=unclassified Mesorhizobium TaxID=325217 RepID=UPI000F7578AC|nr:MULTISPECIES: hypothetical protein [unclassified Mesorhizobium]AZO22747.1 hypothetical protein EJ070_20190 [Mesorhizobium sp. M1E.F.Ca.ET.045.02.1.1]RUW23079.1 hypothetical protein EOA38_30325 [Mesorhizobium sp. M1E.F.Ca.ET.041.01.1.1]RUW84331.1 hypothetical protein EOA29_09735 [Mesorhizobium sp. M1E.F.Ca.ET.063.01.1.1]RWD88021.1 MAG: hypothetical protein EOS38_16505 [Mesorhizobium sp.]RWD94053.1 MAG: hypothetical protein EOS39_08875 [Mesorhizobium sp.]